MDCCENEAELSNTTCPRCHSAGRSVQLMTVKCLLTARALERIAPTEHRFCASSDCEIVYFSDETLFGRDDVRVRVFQKEPKGRRMLCYCFEITEDNADTSTESRIRAHVQGGRCACEARNPEGKCCLGNLRAVAGATRAEVSEVG